ncbi:Probable sensor-like histidine kinase YehU [uncultured Blautia sp.]|uniref:sensor histidine kinase n=1 Tax=Blautia acetigignens TaxID=2981783 RepID=UPI0008207D4C|nr:histidine kinase [Blautia acetigignens]MCU6776466.1 histidine kinase [Blautia acetigignens]SCI12480.1 Probable sensor-like histidine kinase YehU [uncultured Blautia sp.]
MEKKKQASGIQKAWRQLSIQNQIFLSMFLITLLGVGVLMNIVYKASVDAIEQNYRASYQSTLKNSSRVLDMNLKNIVDVGRSFLNDKSFQQILENGNKYGGSKFSSGDRTKLRKVANEMASQQVWVNYIVFTDLYGHVYQLNNINQGTYDFYMYYADKDILKEDWVKVANEAKGREVFFKDSILAVGSKAGFCYAKYMINPSDGEGMGYMVVGLSQKLLGKSFVMGNEGFNSSNFMVLDEDGELIYFVGNEERETAIMEAFSNPEKNSLYLFSSVTNYTTEWSIVNVVEKNELSEESKGIRLISFWVAGCVLVVGFIMARIISRTISQPLKQLENTIAQVGEGERHITEEFDYSEVGRIGQKFKEMVNTNLELSEHLMAVKLNEREAELLLLQSQINPHFLYNTLDSLYFVAIMHGDDQMAEMVEALSDNFKLALNNGNKYIKVADSVKWMQGYMKLQNMRYNNRFELFVDISREILQRETITFIFQPFIENAMYHGLEPKIGKGKISLRGWQEQNNMIFTIEDDGVGIDDMSRLENGYGVRNVIERIKLNYGEKYGVIFESSPGKGTKVTIVVPVK